MKYCHTAIVIGILSSLLLSSAFYYYHYNQIQAVNNYATFLKILKNIQERQVYVDKLDTLKEYSKKIISVSKERKINVNYEILLQDHSIKELYSKISSTYTSGLFFLEKATIESSPSGLIVSVNGFKLGEKTP